MQPEHALKEQGHIIHVPKTTRTCELLSRFTASDRDRFWSKVNKTDACWLWTGAVSGRLKYGSFANGRVNRNGRMVAWPLAAHRVAWLLTHGFLPEGQSVLHHCDVPRCVNPSHLFLGTQSHNMRDASAKGHLSQPRKRNRAIKAAVIAAYLAGGVTAEALAAANGVHKLTVHRWIKAATGGVDQRHSHSGNRRSA